MENERIVILTVMPRHCASAGRVDDGRALISRKKGCRPMTVNFCPNREQMIKEVEECVNSSKLDVLTSICTCCVYKIFDESTLVSQCVKCGVQQGIAKIAKRNAWTASPDPDFLGVC